MRTFLILLALTVLAACGREADVPAATRTTIVISEPDEQVKEPLAVRDFTVRPETVRRGQPATVTIELAAPRPSQQLSVDWYGPDGWLVAYQVHGAAEARLTLPAPIRAFDEAGRYRAVLRSGGITLAEDGLIVRPEA